MQIVIASIFEANNYGAALQALALQRTIEKYCPQDTVKIANYCPLFTKYDNALIRTHIGGGAKKIAHMLLDMIFFFSRKKRLKAFEQFRRETMNLTQPLSASDEIDADIFISGSDQVWNPYLTDNKVDKVYFGCNVKQKGKKMSYASSAGDYSFEDEFAEQIFSKLETYDAISVREKITAEILSRGLSKKVYTNCDPTLLLSEKEWHSTLKIQKIHNEKYIFLFSVQGYVISKKMFELGIRLAKQNHMKVFAIGCEMPSIKMHRIIQASPKDFLQLLYNAAVVITNSYHGTVFSLIFKKPFIVTENRSGPGRIIALLEQVGALNHYYTVNYSNITLESAQIDSSEIDSKILLMRKAGQEYLTSTLKTLKGDKVYGKV